MFSRGLAIGMPNWRDPEKWQFLLVTLLCIAGAIAVLLGLSHLLNARS